MIFHPLKTLLSNGITDITIVSTPSGVGQLANMLGSGIDHGCCFTYRVQDQPGGILGALACAENTDDSEQIAVILGDNVFLPSPVLYELSNDYEGMVFLAKQPYEKLQALGVAIFDEDESLKEKRLIGIIEKPDDPPSEYAVTGLYVFGPDVFHNARSILPGVRGEREISDLLDNYADSKSLAYKMVDGFWGDAGTFEGLAECSRQVELAKGK